MHVQNLHAKNLLDVRDLAIAHHDELGGVREFDSAAVVWQANHMLTDEKREYNNCWIVYTDADEAVGYLAASCPLTFYSWRRIAVQQMFYVLPAHRASRAAVMLVNEFNTWAKERHCEEAHMTVEHEVDSARVARTEKFVNRLGYKTRGFIAIKRIG